MNSKSVLKLDYGHKIWKLSLLIFYLCFYFQDQSEIPGWSGFNQILSKCSFPLSLIGYLPVIDASPTEKSTVNAILEKSLDIADSLRLTAVVLVMDQAIYAKAQEIRWQGIPEFRDRLVIRLGEFHTAMAFLGTIGKRFGDAGLRDVAIESGLVAQGSINGVISGHHYNRSVRCHKIVAEGLHRLRLQEYIDQLSEAESLEAATVMQLLQDSFPNTFLISVQSESVTNFLQQYEDYVAKKCSENEMYAFWSSYLEMVELLLLFLRGTREGNWELHLSSVREMLPWFFAYGRINYSRYLPVYYLEMICLEETHPDIHSHFCAGEFAVKRHNNYGFAMTACDQVIEQTYNRDSKTRGGLTGITLNKAAVKRWTLSHPARAAITNACYRMSLNTSERHPGLYEAGPAKIRSDEEAIQSVMETFTGFFNPFTGESGHDIFSISSGKVAPENVRSDLTTAFNRGEDCFQSFVQRRLLDKEVDVFEKLSLPSCKTFSDIDKKSLSRSSQSTASVKEHRDILARMLMIAQEKGLNLKDTLKYPLSSMPNTLANFDGSMVKTTKAALLHELEKLTQVDTSSSDLVISHDSVVIIDAMVLIQQQRHIPETFGDFATSILKQILSFGKRYMAKRIDFVTDRYKDASIKCCERERRAGCGSTNIRINGTDQKMPKQMKKYLACGSNKERLLTFIVEQWKKASSLIPGNIDIYATQGEDCFKIYKSADNTLVVEEVQDLHSNQEEADSRMLLHAYQASKSSSTIGDIIICTVDTDVFILALWVSNLLHNRLILLFMNGNQSRKFDLKSMSSKLPEAVVEAVVGLHPFTGCDSVSAFKGKGKVKALRLMMESNCYIRAFCELGKQWQIQKSLVQDLERFVCELYGWKDCSDVNVARYNCFCFGRVDSLSMPPNSDSLRLHTWRANYQAGIYRRCLMPVVEVPDPTEHGWKAVDSVLDIQWISLPVAPDSVLQNVYCSCKKSLCTSNKCSCKKGGMECTAMCRCKDCQNISCIQCNHSDDVDDSDTDSDSC